MVRDPRRRYRDELAQRKKRQESEQDDGSDAANEHRDHENRGHLPPGTYAVAQIAERLTRFPADCTRQRPAAGGGQAERDGHSAEKVDQLPVDQQFHSGLSRQTASRIRVRKSFFGSDGLNVIGGPKVTELSSGTGRITPLGRIRFRLSRYTGTSSTSGRIEQRWNKPLLKTPTFSPVPRVPSGKMISE